MVFFFFITHLIIKSKEKIDFGAVQNCLQESDEKITLSPGLVWLDWALWHINNYNSFNAKSFSYIYIKYT